MKRSRSTKAKSAVAKSCQALSTNKSQKKSSSKLGRALSAQTRVTTEGGSAALPWPKLTQSQASLVKVKHED